MAADAIAECRTVRSTVLGLVGVGVSHRRCDQARLSAIADHASDLARALSGRDDLAGVVVVSTCNRLEAYVRTDTPDAAVAAAGAVLREATGHADDLEVRHDEAAARHLIEVASGLDSVVVGEDEVAGQVRCALAEAQGSDPMVRRLFQVALQTSRAVRGHGLGAAGRSMVTDGLDVLEDRHGRVDGRRVLLVGTGSYARVVTAALVRRGVTDLRVYSSSGRAAAFAASHPVEPVETDRLAQALAWADVVVTCSGIRPRPLTSTAVAWGRSRSDPVLPVLDLTLGGDVSPHAAALPQVEVIDLDDVAAAAGDDRSAAVEAARHLVSAAVREFIDDELRRQAAPFVVALRAHVDTFVDTELAHVRHRYSPDVVDAVERSLSRVRNALLHEPSVRAGRAARMGELDEVSEALRVLFGLES